MLSSPEMSAGAKKTHECATSSVANGIEALNGRIVAIAYSPALVGFGL
jgi:hypothetical protein